MGKHKKAKKKVGKSSQTVKKAEKVGEPSQTVKKAEEEERESSQTVKKAEKVGESSQAVKNAEKAEKSSQTVNDGARPISNELLESMLSDGAMSRAELSQKCQRLNSILTASPEQLKKMGIEAAELEQILDFCDSLFTLALSEMDQHLSTVENFIASKICNPSRASFEVLMKKTAPIYDATSRINPYFQGARLDKCHTRLKQVGLGADLEDDDVVELVQILKECINISKAASDETDKLGALIKDLKI